MSFILSTIKNLAGSNPIAEETGVETANEGKVSWILVANY